jgi:ABC-type nitrate/sulfonate/bicarbonate transport system substrate-binding protein
MIGQFLSAVAFLVLLLLHTTSAAQERPKVFLGASSKTLGYSPLWVGVKRKFFEQQGLDVRLVLLRGVPLNYAAEELGFNTLGRLFDAVPNFQAAAIVVRRSWAENNRAVMVRFMKAMVQSHRWLHDNRDAAVEFLSKELQLKPAHALKGWEYYTQNRVWPVDGEPNLEE